jgi:hypothetical protein
MDGFKNSTRMKYMCGGPVKKATGGVIKSAAPKSAAMSAAAGKQLPTPEIAPKPIVNRPAPKDVVREAPRPTMEPKRQVQPTPPKDVKTIGGAPKSAKTMGGEPRRSDEGISAKQRLAGTAGDYAAPPEKAAATPRGMSGSSGKATATPRGMSAAPEKAMVAPRGMGAAKAISSVGATKKGVPVASNKPMIGLKGGGHVTKSMTKW